MHPRMHMRGIELRQSSPAMQVCKQLCHMPWTERQPLRMSLRRPYNAWRFQPHPRSLLAEASISTETPVAPPPPFLDPCRDGLRDSAGRLLLRNMTLTELKEWCASQGEASPERRARQMYSFLYGNGKWIRSIEESDMFPKHFSRTFKDKVGTLSNEVREKR